MTTGVSFLETRELEALGFASIGRNVRISRHATFYGLSRIAIGDNSRIDDFAVLSAGAGGIRIGRHVHIAVMCSLQGNETITLDDYSTLSSRVAVYSSSDDYSGAAMTNPTVPAEFTNVMLRPVHVGRHVVVGSGCVLLPGATLGEGAALGSLSLAKGVLEEFFIYAGVPARKIKARSRDLLELEQRLEGRGG